MDAPIMPIKAIKKILGDELESFKRDTILAMHRSNVMSGGVPDEMIYIAYNVMREKLRVANSYDELYEYITFAGYRMSLEDWINSL